MIVIMKLSVILVPIALAVYRNVECRQFSHFTKTKVILNTCDDSLHLLTNTVRRRFDCGIACTKESYCRRYLYCSVNSECRLYQDGTDCIKAGDTTGCSCYRKEIGQTESSSTITCPLGFYGESCQHVIADCIDGAQHTFNISSHFALFYIQPNASFEPFEVACTTGFGGGTIILERSVSCSYENFNRSLEDYEKGFGVVPKNRWIGFDKIQAIINNKLDLHYYLQFILFNSDWVACHQFYHGLKLGNKSVGHTLLFDYQTGNCGDSITGSLNLEGRPFSAYDADYTNYRCAERYGGGWWFANHPNCTRSFLTGSVDDWVTNNIWLDDKNGMDINQATVLLFGRNMR